MVPIRRWTIFVTQARLEKQVMDGWKIRIRMISSMRLSSSFPPRPHTTIPAVVPNIIDGKVNMMSSFSPPPPSSVKDEGNPSSLSADEIINEEDVSSPTSVIYREIDQDTDDLMSHLRVRLYSSAPDPCGTLLKLYECASVQEVFDVVEASSEVNVKFSSQALVTLWDIQKLLFKLGPLFEPEKDFVNKAVFIKSLAEHPTFLEKILRPVLENHKELEDEPLCASLMCLKRMNYPLVEFEPLIEECIRRKDTLQLPGLSRLSVTLRSESLYGHFVMANFMPLVARYIDKMNSDMDFRLVSIMLKGMPKFLTDDLVNKYLTRVNSYVDKDRFQVVTYCKIFLLLMDMGKEAYPLFQKIGKRLASKVQDMELMEVLSLQRFLASPLQEPYPLIEALLKKHFRMIEEDELIPRLDSLSSVAPYLKTIQHRKKLSTAMKVYMDKSDFDSAIHVLFTILKSIRTNDSALYNQYWNNVLKSLENCPDQKRVLSFAKNYLNFTHSLMSSYRNVWFENVMKKTLYSYLNDYMLGKPVFLSPSDFSTLIAFLVAFDQFFVDVQYLSKLSDFAPQFKAIDLYFIGKGVDSAMINVFRKRVPTKNYETMIQICSIIEEESALRLLQESEHNNISNIELLTISRLSTVASKVKGDSPLFDMSMRRIIKNGIYDTRELRELCHVLSNGNYYYPKAMEAMSKFIVRNLDYLSPETAERFLLLSYAVGWENYDLPFEKLAALLEMHWDKLGLGVIQSAIALAYHLHLSPVLVRNIFTVEFLDQIDEELSSSFGNNSFYPVKLRVALMELNRTICLDMPDANLPWFHDKFCENIISQGRTRETYMQTEVFNVLNDLLGEYAVVSNVCCAKDYYYPIDFVIEFDQFNRPIRRKRKTSFFQNFKDQSPKVSRKVAILILQPSAFTKNVRNLKGNIKLKQRHLEMLGYHVVKIDSYLWNSMYMSENLAKQNFLESQIFQ